MVEELEQNQEKRKLIQKLNQRLNRTRKLTKYKHRGYDFDGAAGHDLLVTDKIISRVQNAIWHQMSSGPSIFSVHKMTGSFSGQGSQRIKPNLDDEIRSRRDSIREENRKSQQVSDSASKNSLGRSGSKFNQGM